MFSPFGLAACRPAVFSECCLATAVWPWDFLPVAPLRKQSDFSVSFLLPLCPAGKLSITPSRACWRWPVPTRHSLPPASKWPRCKFLLRPLCYSDKVARKANVKDEERLSQLTFSENITKHTASMRTMTRDKNLNTLTGHDLTTERTSGHFSFHLFVWVHGPQSQSHTSTPPSWKKAAEKFFLWIPSCVDCSFKWCKCWIKSVLGSDSPLFVSNKSISGRELKVTNKHVSLQFLINCFIFTQACTFSL